MGLVYITGISGAGKSEVCKGLQRLGYSAFGTDEDGISAQPFLDGASKTKLSPNEWPASK